MKLFRHLILFSLLFISSRSFGQATETVIYLKNGNTVKGTILEQAPNQYVDIKTPEGNTIRVKYEEIDRIKKAPNTEKPAAKTSAANPSATKATDSYPYKQRGHIAIPELHYNRYPIKDGYHPGIDMSHAFGFSLVNAYQINSYVSIGVGVGLERHSDATILPLTLDTRFTFIKAKVSPGFNLAVGYAKGLGDAQTNFLVNPSFGIKSYFLSNVAFVVNLGYKLQGEIATFTTYTQGAYGYPNSNYGPHLIITGVLTLSTGFIF